MNCHLDGCDADHHTNGYCAKHWYEMTPFAQRLVIDFAPPFIIVPFMRRVSVRELAKVA